MRLPLLAFLSLCLLSHPAYSVTETPVQLIPLAPPLNQPKAEISGMTWCQDTLILMPQYPRRLTKDKKSYFYTLEKQSILDFLDGKSDSPLQAKPIRVDENKLRKQVSIFDGFEAIACRGDQLWLAVEATNLLGNYHGVLVEGTIELSGPAPFISLKPQTLWNLGSQSRMRNKADEAVLLAGDQLISLHEVNDPRVVEHPAVNVLSLVSGAQSKLPFPHLPFRITDATSLDTQNRFWVINYKYSGDKFSRKAPDPLAEQYGQGASHAKYYNVERLVEFEISDSKITRVTKAPLQLRMEGVEGRNWEGLVRLEDRGFLLATDKHPATLFGFVPYSK